MFYHVVPWPEEVLVELLRLRVFIFPAQPSPSYSAENPGGWASVGFIWCIQVLQRAASLETGISAFALFTTMMLRLGYRAKPSLMIILRPRLPSRFHQASASTIDAGKCQTRASSSGSLLWNATPAPDSHRLTPLLLGWFCFYAAFSFPSWITALSRWGGLHNSMKLWAIAVQGHSRWTGHSEEFWQSAVRWRRKWQPAPLFLPGEPHGLYEKAKRYAARRCVSDSMAMNLSKLQETVGDRGAWPATVYAVTKSQIRLSDWTATTSSHI